MTSRHDAGLQRGPRKRLAAVAAAATALTLAGLGVATAANAAPATSYDNPAPGGVLPSGDTNAASGLIFTDSAPDGSSVRNSPLGSLWIKDPKTGQSIRTVCNQYGTAFQPTAATVWSESTATDANAARMAYILNKYLGTGPANDAAVQDAEHLFYEGVNSQPLNTINASPSGAATHQLAQQMWAESAPYTGSYAAQPSVQSGPNGAGTGTVTNTQVTSATGTISVPITLTLSGGAVFDATGTPTYSGNAGDAPAFHLPSGVTPNPASVGVKETTSASLSQGLRVFTSPGVQTQLAAAAPAAVTGQSADAQITLGFQPTATSVAPVYLNVGDTFSDALTVSTANGGADWIPGTPVNFKAPVYGPFDTAQAAAAAQPAGAAVAATVTGTATAPGKLTLGTTTKVTAPGFYYPVAEAMRKDQPAQYQPVILGDWKAGFNDTGEQSIVRWSPKYTTQTSALSADGTVHDTVTVSDAAPGQSVSPVGKLFISYDTKACAMNSATGAPAPADAQLVGTGTGTGQGNGSVDLSAVQLSPAENNDVHTGMACVYWVDSSDQTDLNDAVKPSAALIASETVWLAPKPAVVPSTPAPSAQAPIPTQAPAPAVTPSTGAPAAQTTLDATPSVKADFGHIATAEDGSSSLLVWGLLAAAAAGLIGFGVFLVRRPKAAAEAGSIETMPADESTNE
ncbi:hypothetical protein [Arthrobacter bambusae]|uniref:Uncharacterized protein n=1 Tax=Arthrobacter bambusae TaxID=1338426 RepID=A0AAW8DFM7_9MICC|nr:hypothetical protein [Arthrobacter bambusae]MDP9904701.1 hypothetical protein [Arthrobacter bambusae]MDQ0129517.1 hypothetical protein [Arthrobacter bambusae]MDQ0180870.1 hypothetical protein [Arthrobacter bambusae]